MVGTFLHIELHTREYQFPDKNHHISVLGCGVINHMFQSLVVSVK